MNANLATVLEANGSIPLGSGLNLQWQKAWLSMVKRS